MASFIGKKLDINGSINIEFIKHNDKYYLMDINPRFSGGIDFSYKCSGYDFVLNHCRCFCSDELEPARKYESKILIKSPDGLNPLPVEPFKSSFFCTFKTNSLNIFL